MSLCDRTGVPKESPGEAKKVQPRCSRRPQNTGDPRTMAEHPRTAAAMEQSGPEPTGQAGHAAAIPVEGAQKTVNPRSLTLRHTP